MMKCKQQVGSTLIEVMVALLVLAIGLLGFAGMQTNGIVLARKAYLHSQAAFFADDIVERIRANLDANTLVNYAMAETASPPSATTNCSAVACTPATMAQWDRREWATSVFAAIPNSRVSVALAVVGGVTVVTIQITYQLNTDTKLSDVTATGQNAVTDTNFTYRLSTELPPI